jgi:hypothetical protein
MIGADPHSVGRYGTALRLQGQARRQHLMRKFSGVVCLERTLQELPDFRRFGIELAGEDADVITVPHQLGFQVVNLSRQDWLDHLNGYWLLANAKCFFECQREVLLICNGVRSFAARRPIAASSVSSAGCIFSTTQVRSSQSMYSRWLPAMPSKEKTVAHNDLFHRRPAQVVAELGMSGKYDRQRATPVRQALQAGQRLGM